MKHWTGSSESLVEFRYGFSRGGVIPGNESNNGGQATGKESSLDCHHIQLRSP